MFSNFIKDVSTGDVYLMSDLMNGKKTAVKGSFQPMSGIIVCPETGRYVDLVELFLGNKKYLDNVNFDMSPLSGVVKNHNNENINLVELILSCAGGSSNTPNPGGDDWVIKRINLEDFFVRYLSDEKQKREHAIVNVTYPRKKYFFAEDEEVLFDKENIFDFNGLSTDNVDSNKFCSIGILSDETSLEGVGFGEGYVYTCTLKNSENNHIFNEKIEEVY